MSLDCIQNKNGQLSFVGAPTFGTTGTASTVASNQFPAGYNLGDRFGVVAANNSSNGGALVLNIIPRGLASTDAQVAAASTGTITHDQAAVVLLSAVDGGAYRLQPATSHGQMLILKIFNAASGSIISTINTQSPFGTTTANGIPVVDQALTFASNGALVFVAAAQKGNTASTNWPYMWCAVARL